MTSPSAPISSVRSGPHPATAVFPNKQLDQNAPSSLQEDLLERARALPGVSVGPGLFEPGSRGMHLDEDAARAGAAGFLAGTEFAHVHDVLDGSLHMVLPAGVRSAMVDAGWGDPHPFAGKTLRSGFHVSENAAFVFGPRDADELEVVWGLVRAAHAQALESHVSAPRTPYEPVRRITDETSAWDGVDSPDGPQGWIMLRVGDAELGALHPQGQQYRVGSLDGAQIRALATASDAEEAMKRLSQEHQRVTGTPPRVSQAA